MKKILSLLLLLISTAVAAKDEVPNFVKPSKTYRYRISFTDKKHNAYSTKHPEAFLSPKALERRRKYGIKVDEHDLPVTQIYLDYLNKHQCKVLHVSKWNNTAVVEVSDTTAIHKLSEVTFVQATRKVWESPDSLLVLPPVKRLELVENRSDTLQHYYGNGQHQAAMLRTDFLHQNGYKGEGITIAVIDGGFYNTDAIAGLKDCRIVDTHNFANPHISVYDEPQQHGTMVLSCMAARLPHQLVGTAPEAAYLLLVSEDNNSENIVEEDNWCAAVEYADSAGADIVTSSLGYFKFDDAQASHRYEELDGQTAINSRSASMAASRGLLVINSAGNEGDNTWKKIGFPADAKDMLTVGAVNAQRVNTAFSSIGNTADGRIKPDIMAQGGKTAVLDCRGNVVTANGTSFSAPVFCGAAACLLQAFPQAQPEEIIRAVQLSGDNSRHPNNIFGYGIPDMQKAYQLLKD